MSLPNDVARCPGVRQFEYSQEALLINRHPECRDCLRRTSPGGEYTPHMDPPRFTTTCPYRIAPHD